MNDELFMTVGSMQVDGTLTAYFEFPRRKLKRFRNRQRKFEQKMRRLAFKGKR